MDPLAVQCKKKLESFRIKELKDVLSRIGVGKQGKKQVLVDKIMAIMLAPEREPFNPIGLKFENLSVRYTKSREDVARAIDDVYRMQRCGAPDLATRIEPGNSNGIGSVPVGSYRLAGLSKHIGVPRVDSRTRCPCGSTLESGTMIQCEAPSCLAWQHVGCVIVPEKEDMKPEIPTHFFCEICRIQHGDPFCVSVAHPLMPSKTTATIVYAPEGGSSILQNLEASFMLARKDWELLHIPDFDLQIWCVLLGDEVAFRMHWPLKAELRVNGDYVRVTNRPGQQKLGANGRDDGPVITDLTREGLNRVSFTAHDGRYFCLGVRVIQRLTTDQVMRSIPSESQGESFDVALSRVRRCIGGGGGALDDDSDSDLEVVSEWVTVNLRCPMSGSRMKLAGRFKPCVHMGCFDLHTFVELNRRARKWQCPICLKNYSLKDLIIDPFFTQITRALESYDEDVSEVEMKPDGCWRPKQDGDSKLNEPWRSPVGLINFGSGVISSEKVLNPVKVEEGLSVERVPLKLGLKRTQDGSCKFIQNLGPADLTTSNMMHELQHQAVQNKVKSLNSVATASNEISSINQEPMEFYNPFGRDEVEISSSFVSAPTNVFSNGFIGGELDQETPLDVIVLSDTEEEYSNAYNLGADGSRLLHTNPVEVQQYDEGCFLNVERGFAHGVSNNAVSDAAVGSFQRNATVALDFFGTNRGTLDAPLAQEDSQQRESYIGPFNFLSSVTDAATVGQSSDPPNLFTPVQAHKHAGETSMLETAYASYNKETQSFDGQNNQSIGDEGTHGLVALDSSLRDFLPHQPAKSAVNSNGHVPQEALNDDMQEGWFSLTLGGSESFANAATSLYPLSHQTTEVNTLDDSASALLDLSSYGTRLDGSILTPKVTKDCSVTHPPQYQRALFCIDSDSD